MNAAALPAPLAKLNEIHVFGLQALRPFFYFKRYSRALVERTVSARGNGGEMDESIFPTLALDKPKSLAVLNHFTVPVLSKRLLSAI